MDNKENLLVRYGWKPPTYTIIYKCNNCDEEGVIDIRQGKKIIDQPCPCCGCKTLIKIK